MKCIVASSTSGWSDIRTLRSFIVNHKKIINIVKLTTLLCGCVDSIMVSISACHAEDRSSIPRRDG